MGSEQQQQNCRNVYYQDSPDVRSINNDSTAECLMGSSLIAQTVGQIFVSLEDSKAQAVKLRDQRVASMSSSWPMRAPYFPPALAQRNQVKGVNAVQWFKLRFSLQQHCTRFH